MKVNDNIMKPLISVVMPVYNEKIYELKDSINSILSQTFKGFEYVIVDDNPLSNKIKQFLIRESYKDSRVKLLFNSTNRGIVYSVNKGIRNSKGKFIARMDADDISKPNRLNEQLHFLIRNKLDLVCFNYSTISLNGHLLKKDCYSNITQIAQNKLKQVMLHCNIANGPSFLFKRVVFDKIKGYRVNLIDDYDFACRALIYGFKMGYQSSSLIYKRNRLNSLSNTNALKQFVGIQIISYYLKKYDYSRVVPVGLITNKFNNISEKDLRKFKYAKQQYYLFKHTKNIYNLLLMLLVICTSRLIFHKCLWNIFIRNNQNKYLK